MARAWLHKLRRELVCQDRDWLSSTVEVDEVYVGGRDRGARGRSREKRGNRARAKGKSPNRSFDREMRKIQTAGDTSGLEMRVYDVGLKPVETWGLDDE